MNSKDYQKIVKKPQISKEKLLLENYLKKKCDQCDLHFEKEFRFYLLRKWRFDYCAYSYFIESPNSPVKIALEFEGIFSNKSRHTSIKGFLGDVEKYNQAAFLGWKVYRFTANDFTKVNIEKTYKFIDQILEVNNT